MYVAFRKRSRPASPTCRCPWAASPAWRASSRARSSTCCASASWPLRSRATIITLRQPPRSVGSALSTPRQTGTAEGHGLVVSRGQAQSRHARLAGDALQALVLQRVGHCFHLGQCGLVRIGVASPQRHAAARAGQREPAARVVALVERVRALGMCLRVGVRMAVGRSQGGHRPLRRGGVTLAGAFEVVGDARRQFVPAVAGLRDQPSRRRHMTRHAIGTQHGGVGSPVPQVVREAVLCAAGKGAVAAPSHEATRGQRGQGGLQRLRGASVHRFSLPLGSLPTLDPGGGPRRLDCAGLSAMRSMGPE